MAKHRSIVTGLCVGILLAGAAVAEAEEGSVVAWGKNDYGQCNVPEPNAGFVAVAGGYDHTLGLKSDGTIAAWGLNDYGQCNVPEPNAGFVGIATKSWHNLGLKSDGTIIAWGRNSEGQCVVPSPNASFVAAATGEWHSLGLKSDGTIVTWGTDTEGQCVVPAPNAGFVAVAAGFWHSVGLKSDGTVVVWGRNIEGQCIVPEPNADFVAIAAGDFHCIGLRSDGTLVTWGHNDCGQLDIPEPNADFIAIAGGARHSLALKSDGTARVWGHTWYGVCDVPGPNADFIAIAGGVFHSLALRHPTLRILSAVARNGVVGADVTVRTRVQAGDYPVSAATLFYKVNGGVEQSVAAISEGEGIWAAHLGQRAAGTEIAWRVVASDAQSNSTVWPQVGGYRVLKVIQSGRILAWGYNGDGRCDVPEPNEDFVALGAGHRHSLGLKSDGSVAAWGWNDSTQCSVPWPNDDFVAVAGGYCHSLGLKSDGTAVAWGGNAYGPIAVPEPNADFIAAAACVYHSVGLKSDGTIVAWGNNDGGQCDVPEPNAGFVAVGGGYLYSLGLKTDGTVVAWGYNNDGECDVPAPNADFVAVDGGYFYGLGLKSDGTVVAWGDNSYGQCDVPAPNADFIAIEACGYHSLGLKSDGTVVAWGRNNYGQCDVPAPSPDFVAVAGGGVHSLVLEQTFQANIVCDPDPEHLTNTAPSKTIAVDYLGGGGGLVYAYSVSVTWDDTKAALVGITEGDLLSSQGPTWFEVSGTGNSRTVDCVLMGAYPGVSGPGTLFTVEFTGAGCGPSPVDVTMLAVRDNMNMPLAGFYEDDGSIVVDLTNPVLTVNGPWPDGACYWVAPVLDLAAGDTCGDLDDAFWRVDAGSWQTDAGLFTDYGGPSWTNAAWALPGFAGLAEGSHTVEFYCTDEIGNSSSIAGWSFIKDTVHPPPVTGFAASPGHRKVHLSWANPASDFDHVVVVRKAWAAASPFGYPEYIQPADGYPAHPGDGVAVYNGTGASYDDLLTLDDRSIYFYRAFTYDCAGNSYGGVTPGGAIPAAFAQGDRATNYWLGDVSKAGGGGCDGYVDYFDIVALSAGYWLYSPASPPGAPYNECDVGPTDDRSRLGLPLPDDYLDFEDLMILSLNYSVVTPLGRPMLPGTADEGPVALRLEADGAAGVGDHLLVRLMLDGNRGEVKGVSVVLNFEPGSLELIGTAASSAFTEADESAFFKGKETEPGALWIDLAALGTDRAITGSGELAELVFGVKDAGSSGVRFSRVVLRGIDNEPVAAESEDLVLDAKPDLPKVTRLIGAQPNPINLDTSIGYDISEAGPVQLRVYDVAGRLVSTLVAEEQPAGSYTKAWNGLDAQGRAVPCGVYFVRMQAPGYQATAKLVKIK